MDIRIERTTKPKQHADESKLGFGQYFTDHMFWMDYTPEEGWHDARIVPYGPITLSPAATVLHYGMEIFEGLKAYRRADGKVQLFRPWDNFARMNDSAERLCLPQIDAAFAQEALETLIRGCRLCRARACISVPLSSARIRSLACIRCIIRSSASSSRPRAAITPKASTPSRS